MKPTKNKIFCNGCQRSKMLFESKAKADKFIMYNSEGILEENGRAPVRSYYCEFCCGYHVTSNPSAEVGEKLSSRDQKLLNQIHYSVLEGKEFDKLWLTTNRKIDIAKEKIFQGDFLETNKLFLEFQIYPEILRNLPIKKRTKYMLLRQKIESLHNVVLKLENLLKEGQTEFECLDKLEDSTEKDEIIITALPNILFSKFVKEGIQKVKDYIEEEQIEKAHETIKK